jgi:hypothetical protein
MTTLTPSQLELITTAWSELSPHNISVDRIKASIPQLMDCVKHWDLEQLTTSTETHFEGSLLKTIGRQTYRSKAKSIEIVHLLLCLVSSYRFALALEGIYCSTKPNHELGWQIDWLSLATINREDYLIKHKEHVLQSNKCYLEDDFYTLYQAYRGESESHLDSNTRNTISDISFRASSIVDPATLKGRTDGHKEIIRQYRIEYSYETNNALIEREIKVTLCYNCQHYIIYNDQLLFDKIVRSDIVEEVRNGTGSTYFCQVIGRSLSVDETSDWADLSGLPGLSRLPLVHLGRSAPFYIHISRNDSSSHASTQRPDLLVDGLVYSGMFDTFGSVLYHERPQHTQRQQSGDLPVFKGYPEIAVDIDFILPGSSAISLPPERLPMKTNNNKSYYLKRALLGSAILKSDSFVIARSQADLASIRYISESGEILSNLSPAVLNGTFIVTDIDNFYAMWRYEPNFNSWSGRMVDSFRTMCRHFLLKGSLKSRHGVMSAVSITNLPDDSWIEDVRLFLHKDKILGSAALFMPALKLTEKNLLQNFNNTGTGMTVSQCLMELQPEKSELRFKGFLNLLSDAEGKPSGVPSFFEKNWAIWPSVSTNRLVYSIEPWISFCLASDGVYHLEYIFDTSRSIKEVLGGVPRLSCHLQNLNQAYPNIDFSIGFFHVRDNAYCYSQYLYLVDNASGRPVCWNSTPFLRLDYNFLLSILSDFDLSHKNPGVCYLSSILIREKALLMMVNMFDSELSVLSVSLDYAMSLLTAGAIGYYSF